MNNQKGQGLIEIIFAVGVLIVVITAVVSLIVKTTGIKSLAIQRKRASEMGEVVIENLMNNKKNDATFWQLNDVTSPQTISGYDGYQYVVDFTSTSEGDCSDTVIECANAVITITFGNNQSLVINRFFSKKI